MGGSFPARNGKYAREPAPTAKQAPTPRHKESSYGYA
jgi:hypothetical protein